MTDYLIPKDEHDDTDQHKRIRALLEKPILTAHDRDYNTVEVKNAIDDLNHKKSARGRWHHRRHMPESLQTIPMFIYTLYNECLRKGYFPKKWKKVKIIPITKPGKENLMEVSKLRPISLINVGGKVLEKILRNRIMHYRHINNLLNQNKYGFTPKKSAIDAALAVKEYLEEGMREGDIAILVSLDVKVHLTLPGGPVY
jgi:hypothetical protein